MATFVHITSARGGSKIARNGIKVSKKSGGVYCMPVTQDYEITMQWARELKRSVGRNLIAFYFSIPDTTTVLFGKYNEHKFTMTAAEAVAQVASIASFDPANTLGIEVVILRRIERNEISKIKWFIHPTGWRYFPDSHNKLPCPCSGCQRGAMGAKSIRERLDK